ncbi:major urinary protein 5-like [Dromiciops gliroides]|uniref:major urinary protein 5-like n=1 Tax=Dromiciops gliroides TaxID=33562 RepID=UPI001CC3D809|nr:major urinary protein 5-like [Dromiciops gliroides]
MVSMAEPGLFIGEWFIIALASNVTSKIEEGGSLKIFIKNMNKHDDDGINDFSLQSMDSKNAMFVLYNINNKEVIVWAELFGWTPDLPDEIKKKFEEMCERFGIRKDQIRDLSNDDR